MYKVGAITVGQSPRDDVMADIQPILGKNIQIIEKGALDGLSALEIEKLAPVEGEYVLVSKLRDGAEVRFAERRIISLLQKCIAELEREGVMVILFLCTGNFPKFQASVPLIFPNEMLRALVPVLSPGGKIAVLTPNETQLVQSKQKWERHANEVVPVAASPYQGATASIDLAAKQIKEIDVDMIVMDCIGYSRSMKERLKAQTGKNILLARTVMARMVRELLD